MKSYTNIEQSKKLAEILPLESADMHYCLENRDVATEHEIGITPFIKAKRFEGKCNITDVQPAWSLAALLNVIPYTIYKSDNEFYRLGIDKGYEDYAVWYNNDGFTITDLDVASDNFIDACVEMIIKLHEQKLL